jgi:hypothetical protein
MLPHKNPILKRGGFLWEHRNQQRLPESDTVLDKNENLRNIESNGEPGGTRTRDHRIKSAITVHSVALYCGIFTIFVPIRCTDMHRFHAVRCK